MGVVEFLAKGHQCLLFVAADGKDVVNVAPANKGLDDGISQNALLQLGHDDVGIRGGHLGTHSCSVDLNVILFSKDKVVD